MKTPQEPHTRPRLKKETLRGLGFAELEQVRGGNPSKNGHPKPLGTRYCLTT